MEACHRALKTPRNVPSSSVFRATVGTGPRDWQPHAHDSWGWRELSRREGPGGRGPGSWLPGGWQGLWALAKAQLEVTGRLLSPLKPKLSQLGGQPLLGRDCHRPSKWAVICSKVFPLVSGTQHTVKRTLPTQKAEASQKAP